MHNNLENKYRLSGSFEKFLADISEGFLTSEQYEKIFKQFEVGAEQFFFSPSSEANLIRILSSLYDKKTFLIDSLKYDHHIEIICSISSLSNYLTDIVVRNPEYLYLLFDQQNLSSEINEEKLYTEVKTSADNFKTLKSKTRLLRNIKRKYLLKTGVADILGFFDLATTASQISILAKTLSEILFDVCYQEIQSKYDIKLENNYTLCSLGKLGGDELNYSSDIDLILFYDKNYEIPGIKKEYHEIISEALYLFIQEATAVTPESYLYRVDFRLRPDGRNSLLCRTETDYLKYYETRGDDWERQMLIKLGFVGGSRKLFEHFKTYLDEFIYPQSFRNSIITTIQKMKKSIEARLNDEKDIKLIPGGIRDIEFSVQALQVINAGRNTNLKTGNTLKALKELRKKELLTEDEYSTLNESYILYRKIEHFVQLMNDKQTHSLPSSPELVNKLAMFLGFETGEKLDTIIRERRVKVRKIYESIVGIDNSNKKPAIEKVNFVEKKKAQKNLEFLRFGISLIGEKQFDKNTVSLFHNIEPVLFNYLQACSSPDIVLENFTRVIKNIKLASIWYTSFEDELFFKSFLKVCEFSQRAIDAIVTSPKLADLFLSKAVFHKINYEENPYSLKELIFILAVQHACKNIAFPEFSKTLSSKISQVISNEIDLFGLSYNYFVAGLGSFGCDEISFGSDIDLIIATENPEDNSIAEKDFQKILNRLRTELSPFEVDFRLRPEGKSAQLVWDIYGYEKYINTRMRLWEFQALSKLKFVCGNKELFDKLKLLAAQKTKTFENNAIIKEVLQMYKSKLSFSVSNQKKISLKASPGALNTIDAMINLVLLPDANLYFKMMEDTSLNKIENFSKNQNIEIFKQAKDNFILLKNYQIGLQNLFNQSKSSIPGNNDKIKLLASYFGFENTDKFYNSIGNILSTDINLLKKLSDKE